MDPGSLDTSSRTERPAGEPEAHLFGSGAQIILASLASPPPEGAIRPRCGWRAVRRHFLGASGYRSSRRRHRPRRGRTGCSTARSSASGSTPTRRATRLSRTSTSDASGPSSPWPGAWLATGPVQQPVRAPGSALHARVRFGEASRRSGSRPGGRDGRRRGGRPIDERPLRLLHRTFALTLFLAGVSDRSAGGGSASSWSPWLRRLPVRPGERRLAPDPIGRRTAGLRHDLDAPGQPPGRDPERPDEVVPYGLLLSPRP